MFAGWSGACTGTATTCTLTMNGPKLVTATFSNKPVLTVTKAGSGSGTVTSSPAGINCGPTAASPTTGHVRHAHRHARTRHLDVHRVERGGCSGTGSCVVTMDASKSVTATFDDVPQLLTVTVSGDGTITSDVGGRVCPGTCAASYPPGTTVILTATIGGT